MTDCDHSKCQSLALAKGLGLGVSLQYLNETRADLDQPGKHVYFYVVSTVKLNKGEFCQTGSAPNFHGGRLSLCTCKHWMRALKEPDDWVGNWVAGFTGIHEGGGDRRNKLIFLMRIDRAYLSFYKLWQENMSDQDLLAAKNSRKSQFGDFYEPKSELRADKIHESDSYYPPMVGHSHHTNEFDNRWRNDIDYNKGKRPPSLLLGSPSASFLWSKPLLALHDCKPTHGRGFGRNHRLMSYSNFVTSLREMI